MSQGEGPSGLAKPMRKYRLHWTIHPEKTVEWYEGEKSRMSEDAVARDLDINYAGSVSGRVFGSFNELKHITKKNPYNPHRRVYRIWDFGKTNCVLYCQIDEHGRVRVLFERVLDPSDTFEQLHVAIQDSKERFPDAAFEDICDPAGTWSKDGMPSGVVQILRDEGIFPSCDRVLHLPMKERTKQGVEVIQKALQTAPGGEEALQIYCTDDGDGCPTLRKAFLGGYAYKRDHAGNMTQRIAEVHPYSEVIDCLQYLYLETDSGATSNLPDEAFRPSYNDDYISPYIGF